METKPQSPPGQINMELGEKEAEGIYSNFVVISHSLSEFVLDFARVVMTPPNVRSLLVALETNIKKYEDQFGKIKTFEAQAKEIGFTS